eukprot:CAMPEP_0114161750 /NCGR_PEP_ID=MMETSP0043_2-20121206/29113_1 /TAXON_ID=464988 /ORGANISM="Hemiselmis andersenii, Strain CCMP644" /LENGTH=89 /DNA_ID=CAMNT_0001257989 /DNA_START=19 /DNA_END=284 /DNA_ORIENTATION=+
MPPSSSETAAWPNLAKGPSSGGVGSAMLHVKDERESEATSDDGRMFRETASCVCPPKTKSRRPITAAACAARAGGTPPYVTGRTHSPPP